MSVGEPTIVLGTAPDAPVRCGQVAEWDRVLGHRLALFDGTGGLLCPGDLPTLRVTADLVSGLVRAVAAGGPQELKELPGAVLLAVPLVECRQVAVGVAVTDRAALDAPPSELADWFEAEELEWREWLAWQQVWDLRQLTTMLTLLHGKQVSDYRARQLEQEVEQVSKNLVDTYEEISLLYTLTQNLRISRSEEELGRLALERLSDCVPACGFAIQYRGNGGEGQLPTSEGQGWITGGDCPLDDRSLPALLSHLKLDQSPRPCVVNRRVTSRSGWPFPRIREMVLVPLGEGDKQFGWLAAFNHQEDLEFGTVEANLMASLGTLLAIHGSNRELYRQQADFVANVVRALVSALDAKDRYTSGHSDRVARFAVRLALELRCDPKLVNTIYMAGLLHDVGKIGIEDSVLRKPGRLTDEEFEHIKRHPELGYRILADLRQLSDVLPAVLHHHERWDGLGYPHGLVGSGIPRIARIMAVADAYDAMTSDRPYRAGMPEEKVDKIFREGSGTYWDPEVVDAYFAAKDDIIEIAKRERSETLNL